MGGVTSRILPGIIHESSVENTPLTIFNTSYTKTFDFTIYGTQTHTSGGKQGIRYYFKKNTDKEWSEHDTIGYSSPMQGSITLKPREKALFSFGGLDADSTSGSIQFNSDLNDTGAFLEVSGDARDVNGRGAHMGITFAPGMKIVSAKNLLGWASFSGFETIVEAPEIIPIGNEQQSFATGIKEWYKDCVNLVKVPKKILGTKINSSWASAFENCVKITRSPEIMPGMYNSTGGYLTRMFYGCSNLSHITVHFKGWAKNEFYGSDSELRNPWAEFETSDWVVGVAPKGVFRCPKELPIIHDTSHIPPGWDVVTF